MTIALPVAIFQLPCVGNLFIRILTNILFDDLDRWKSDFPREHMSPRGVVILNDVIIPDSDQNMPRVV